MITTALVSEYETLLHQAAEQQQQSGGDDEPTGPTAVRLEDDL